MKNSIIKKLEDLHTRYKEIEHMLSDVNIFSNPKKFRKLSKEYLKLSNINNCFINWKVNEDNKKKVSYLLDDSELHDMAEEELKIVCFKKVKLENELKTLLLPNDPFDKKNCFIEIRSATGGDEAAIFAGNLLKMYIRYAELRHWKTEIINITHSDQGGCKDVIMKVTGKGVCGRLKFESGGHRVQRVPQTESQGRIHTSTCTVAIIPVVPEKEVKSINTNDLKIDTFRSSGAGGQHVNTTDSAIRITHIPTGHVVECQDERSQHKNKAKALSVLVSRIQAEQLSRRREEDAIMRRNLLGSGMRSDRNRTYNFSKNRVTDHRINLALYALNDILNGNLDLLIEPIIQEYQANYLSSFFNNIVQ
ncbi:MAG: peptide chain release factor 1 [Buchnera aphidicola (Kaburagia rhusicola rhusicola)]